jgi:hypothetical protein
MQPLAVGTPPKGFMRWQRGALFLIKFLSKLAILGTLSIEGRSTSYPVPASLRPLFAASAAPYFHLRRGFLFACAQKREVGS